MQLSNALPLARLGLSNCSRRRASMSYHRRIALEEGGRVNGAVELRHFASVTTLIFVACVLSFVVAAVVVQLEMLPQAQLVAAISMMSRYQFALLA